MSIRYYLLFFAFVTGQIGRIQFGTSIAMTFLDVAVGVCIITFFLIKGREWKNLTEVPVALPLFLWGIICVLSLGLQIMVLPLHELEIAALYLLRLGMYVALYFVIQKENTKVKNQIMDLMFFSGVIILLAGFIQYFFYSNLRNLYYLGWDDHLYRLFSVFLDPNFAGAFFGLFFIFLCGYVVYAKKKHQKLLLWASFACIPLTFVALFLTQSRSGMLLFVSGMTVFFLLLKKKKHLILMGVVLVIFYGIASRFFYIENINPFRVASTYARLQSSQNALIIISEHPLFGVGFNAYGFAQRQHQFVSLSPKVPSHAESGVDNSFLFVFATTGVVGFSVFIYLLWSFFKNAYISFRKNDSIFALVFISSLAGLLVGSLFINSFFYPALLMWLMLLFALKEKI